jgi:TonB-linked SusC/RagA family outer membrane protein
MGYVGRATYAYDRRYSMEVNVGITGSEAFAQGHRFGVFPAVGLAWIASNENFYPESLKNIVSNLKFRASYGLTGNDAYGNARFLFRGGFTGAPGASLGYNSGTTLNGYNGYTEDRFSAPNISWETEVKKNYGVDIGFFGNKLNLVVDYFDNKRYDILIQRRTVSGAAGFNQSPFQNFGKVNNKGYEASLAYTQRIGENSIISARGNFTYARNKIIEQDEVTPSYPWMSSTGNRLNMNDVFVADRLFEDGDFDITTNPNGSKSYALKNKIANQTYFGSVMPGDIKYKDLNEDGIINQFDRTKYEGNPATPEIAYGFGVSYSYKGLSLSMFFSGVGNTSTVLGASNAQGFFPFNYGVDESSVRSIVSDRWTAANPSQDVLFPRIRTSTFYNNSVPSTWWIRDASFLRLKTAELGYDLPKKILDRIKLDNARVYIQGYNLFTVDHIKFWDPEQGNANAGVTYPQSRTFTFGLQLSL